MGRLRSTVSYWVPVSRVGIALWAWRNRQELTGWAIYAAKSVPKLVGGEHPDVLAEGRLRMKLASDSRTRNVVGLRVSVTDGVATLSGVVPSDAHDAAIAIAANTGGVTRLKDEIEDLRRRSFLRR